MSRIYLVFMIIDTCDWLVAQTPPAMSALHFILQTPPGNSDLCAPILKIENYEKKVHFPPDQTRNEKLIKTGQTEQLLLRNS